MFNVLKYLILVSVSERFVVGVREFQLPGQTPRHVLLQPEEQALPDPVDECQGEGQDSRG